MEKVSGGQSFLASIQNLLIFAIFKSSLNLNHTRNWSENWFSGYLRHALSISEINLAVAKSLGIIGHLTNCCKRPIVCTFLDSRHFNKLIGLFWEENCKTKLREMGGSGGPLPPYISRVVLPFF